MCRGEYSPGEEHPSTLTRSMRVGNLATSLAYRLGGKHADAEEMRQAALAGQQRVLGSAHPTEERLKGVRSRMRAKQPTVKAAARKERAAASPLCPTALAEAEARAAAAESELLVMLELEEALAGGASSSPRTT